MNFEEFVEYYSNIANNEAKALTKNYLKDLGLQIRFVDYNFGRKNWVGVYVSSGGRIKDGIIEIAVNYKNIYKWAVKNGVEETDIEIQIGITVWHEVGHALIDWIRETCYDSDDKNIKKVISMGNNKEEEMVEEFGLSGFSKYTGVYGSNLEDILDILIRNKKINEITLNKFNKLIK